MKKSDPYIPAPDRVSPWTDAAAAASHRSVTAQPLQARVAARHTDTIPWETSVALQLSIFQHQVLSIGLTDSES